MCSFVRVCLQLLHFASVGKGSNRSSRFKEILFCSAWASIRHPETSVMFFSNSDISSKFNEDNLDISVFINSISAAIDFPEDFKLFNFTLYSSEFEYNLSKSSLINLIELNCSFAFVSIVIYSVDILFNSSNFDCLSIFIKSNCLDLFKIFNLISLNSSFNLIISVDGSPKVEIIVFILSISFDNSVDFFFAMASYFPYIFN